MDSQDMYLAPHCVGSCGACPAPTGGYSIAVCRAHHVQDRLVLFPVGTIYQGTRKHYLIGEVLSA